MSLHLFSQILLRRSHEWLEQVTVGRRGHILWAPCHELLEQSRWNSLGITTIYYLSFYYTSEVNSHACDDRDIHVNAGHRSPASSCSGVKLLAERVQDLFPMRQLARKGEGQVNDLSLLLRVPFSALTLLLGQRKQPVETCYRSCFVGLENHLQMATCMK